MMSENSISNSEKYNKIIIIDNDGLNRLEGVFNNSFVKPFSEFINPFVDENYQMSVYFSNNKYEYNPQKYQIEKSEFTESVITNVNQFKEYYNEKIAEECENSTTLILFDYSWQENGEETNGQYATEFFELIKNEQNVTLLLYTSVVGPDVLALARELSEMESECTVIKTTWKFLWTQPLSACKTLSNILKLPRD